jgi:hypothetical protein
MAATAKAPPKAPPAGLILVHPVNPHGFEAEAIIVADSMEDQGKSVQIIVHGSPLVQQRHRGRYLIAAARTLVWDPCKASKRSFRDVVRAALEGLGLDDDDFPCFCGKALIFDVSFHVMNTSKDVDNLLKFVLDALQTVLYSNDRFIYDIHARKRRVYHVGDENTIIEVKALTAA